MDKYVGLDVEQKMHSPLVESDGFPVEKSQFLLRHSNQLWLFKHFDLWYMHPEIASAI